MKASVSIAIGLLVSCLALLWAAGHLDTVSGALCSDEFTLPAMACRFGGPGITRLLVPLSGFIAFLVTRSACAK